MLNKIKGNINLKKDIHVQNCKFEIICFSVITLFSYLWWIINFNQYANYQNIKGQETLLSMFVFISIIFFSYFLILFNDRNEIRNIELFISIVLALIVRLVLGILFYGHPIDINCYLAWMNAAANDLFNIYEKEMFIDYLPGYLIALSLFKKISVMLSLNVPDILIVKLPNIISDIILGLLVIKIKRKMQLNIYRKDILILLFNPLFIILSAIWGQSDSFVIMLFALVLYCLLFNFDILAGFTIAYLFFTKPQFALYFILIVIYWLFNILKKTQIKQMYSQIFAFFVTSFLMYLVFMPNREILWLIKLFWKIANEYPYYSVNAFNIYFVFNLNWVKIKDKFNYLGYILLVTIYFLILISIVTVNSKKNCRDERINIFKTILRGGLIISVFSFSCMPSMHERYLIFGTLFLMLLYVIENSVEYLLKLLILSLLSFMNIAKVLLLSFSNNYFIYRDYSNMLVALFIIIFMLLTFYYLFSEIVFEKVKMYLPYILKYTKFKKTD